MATVSQIETFTSEILSASLATKTASETETESAVATSTGGCSPTLGRQALDRRRIDFPSYCNKICYVPNREEMVQLEIKNVVGETDELIESMCKGILARLAAGQIAAELNDGEDILTYNGRGKRVTTVNCVKYCQS
jgi:hypothetical protein